MGEVNDQIADYRQIAQRFDAQPRTERHGQSAASELLASINHHRARTAHADAAGKPKTQIRRRPALESEEDIENARRRGDFDGVLLEARPSLGFRSEALDGNGEASHGRCN